MRLAFLFPLVLLASPLEAQTCPLAVSAGIQRLQADIKRSTSSVMLKAKVDTTVVLFSAICPPVLPLQPSPVNLTIVPTSSRLSESIRATWVGPVDAISYVYSTGWNGGPVWKGVTEKPILASTALLYYVPNGTDIFLCVWSVNSAGRSIDNGCNGIKVPLAPVDTVVVDFLARPSTNTGAPGHSGNICAFVIFRDGKIARPDPVAAGERCDVAWAAVPAASKSTSPAQQRVADRLPIQFRLEKVP